MVHAGLATIACVLSDPRALARILGAIRHEGGHGVALSQAAVLGSAVTRSIAALVYDMGAYGRSAVDFVRRVHAARPDWPVWLYYIPRAASTENVAEVASLRGVWATPQLAGLRAEYDLRVQARRMLALLPRARLLALLDNVLRGLPPAVRPLLETGLERVERNAGTRVKAREVAADMASTLRQAQRACQAAGLLSPKHLLDRLTLVFVAFKALMFDVPLPLAAQQVGLGPRAFRELQCRVFGRNARWARLDTRSQFDLALIALTAACRLPPTAAEEILQGGVMERYA